MAAKAKTYQTHTGLLICQTEEDGEYVVAIVGERQKELLRTPIRVAATRYFDGLVKHYEARAEAEKVTS